jgi:beta-glucuronidase
MTEKAGAFSGAGYEESFLRPTLDARGLINIAGRETESLNGQWNFAAGWYAGREGYSWYEDISKDRAEDAASQNSNWSAWGLMRVPATWNMERPELYYFEGSGIYTRSFRYIPRERGERLFIRFEGVSYRTSVFINGKFAGVHDGSSTPFNAEITALVKKDNRIVVTADSRRNPLRVPGENMDWFNYGGIYRNIFLLRLGRIFIKDWFIRLAEDGSYSTILSDIYISGGAGLGGNGKAILEIPGLKIREEINVKNGKGSHRTAVPSGAAKINLWSPESPFLYDLTLSYVPDFSAEANTAVDREEVNISGAGDLVHDRIGFREIKTRGQELFLNGKKIFLKGVCLQEDHLTLGKRATEESIRAAIREVKEMGGNYLRLVSYPHDGDFARMADEEGLLLWEETPVQWTEALENPGACQDAENQLSELILRDRNRVSVIIWSIGSGSTETDAFYAFAESFGKKARSLDDTRLISAACLVNPARLTIQNRLGDVLDIIGIAECFGRGGEDLRKFSIILANSDPKKPVLICGFGGDALAGERGTAEDIFSEDYQKALYEKQLEALKKYPYIAGISPWALYDFRCPHCLNRYQQGFSRAGLIDADRVTKKLAYQAVRQFYREE